MKLQQYCGTLKPLSILLVCAFFSSAPAQAGLLDMVTSTVSSASSNNQGSSEKTAGKSDNSFDLTVPATEAVKQYVEIENADKLAGIKKVVIPSFMVDFVTEAKASTQISGIGVMTGAPSNVLIKLKGADDSKFQAITDKLYEQTVAELTAAGIEVVSQDALQASPSYKEISAKSEKAPREEDAKGGKGMFYTAKGTPLYYMDEVGFIPKMQLFGKPKEDVFLTFGTKFGAGFATAMIPQLEEKLAKEFDASVLKVRITVMGGQLEKDESFWNFSAQADIKAKAAASFAPMATRYAFIRNDGSKARVSLKQAVTTKELGKLVNVTSTASKAGDIARNAVTVGSRLASAFGAGPAIDLGYGNTQDYEWQVENGTFENVITLYHPAVARLFATSITQPQPDKVASK